MDEDRILMTNLQDELSDCLEEGKPLDVAGGPPDLGDQDVGVARVFKASDTPLDLVGDVGNDLDGLAEIIAAALIREDGLVDLTAGKIVFTGQDALGEALVVAEIKIGLGAVGQHIHLAVLKRVHRARIHIEVGIEFLHRHPQSTMLQKSSQRCAGKTLAERTDHATRHENVFHGLQIIGGARRKSSTVTSRCKDLPLGMSIGLKRDSQNFGEMTLSRLVLLITEHRF